jgi:hypothetical protein
MYKYCIFFCFLCNFAILSFFMEKEKRHYVVVIDPSGDAKRTGRKIGDNFERGLTLQCAEKIKEYVEMHAPYIKVIISRMPGDVVYDLQHASLSNRLNANLFINLNFYHCQEIKPTVFLYQFSYGADFACCNQGLVLHTYDQAYRINKTVGNEMGQLFKKSLAQQKYQSLFTIANIYHLPIKPLIGIVAPGLCIEAGLKNKEAWVHYVEPLAQGIMQVFE